MGLKRWVFIKLWRCFYRVHRIWDFTCRTILLKIGDMYLQGYPAYARKYVNMDENFISIFNGKQFKMVFETSWQRFLSISVGWCVVVNHPVVSGIRCFDWLGLSHMMYPWGWAWGGAYAKLRGWEKRNHDSSEENPDIGQKKGEWPPGSPPAADLHRRRKAAERRSLELPFAIESESGMRERKIISFSFQFLK